VEGFGEDFVEECFGVFGFQEGGKAAELKGVPAESFDFKAGVQECHFFTKDDVEIAGIELDKYGDEQCLCFEAVCFRFGNFFKEDAFSGCFRVEKDEAVITFKNDVAFLQKAD